MEVGFVIDELGGVVLVELSKGLEDLIFDIADHFWVAPKFVEPLLEFLAVAVAVHDEVEFDIVAAAAQTEAADGEIGAAHDGILHCAVGHMVHFAVEKIGLADGLDVHLLADPFRALTGDALLLELIGEQEAVFGDEEVLGFGLGGVEAVDVGGVTEKEIQVVNAVEMFFQGVVGVDREVGGDDGEFGALLELLAEEVGDGTASMIVSDARGCEWCGHRG